MASRAVQIRHRNQPSTTNPIFIYRFFSSSSCSPPPPPPPSSNTNNGENVTSNGTPPPSSSSLESSYLEIKASLKNQQQPPRKPPSFSSHRSPSISSSSVVSIQEIRKNLTEFRRRSSVPDPSPPQPASSPPIQLREIYNRNVIPKKEEAPKAAFSFEAIRESLKQMQSSSSVDGSARGGGGRSRVTADLMSLKAFKESFNLRPVDSGAEESSHLIGGSQDSLPVSVFGKELKESKEEESPAMKREFLRTYSYEELGEKLREFRPEAAGENWFSLVELNERLGKLREMEKKETKTRAFWGKDLRESLVRLSMSDNEKAKKSSAQRLDILSHFGRTPSFMLSPPKEHLVEKYFHPDNMSSPEKLKVELKKVRDEFKMSESDCGSARVQVAQLTTKIKHLSAVLHKKDKHSRKGLHAMVQRRKKLLKYLRRTDWDSYCLVLSKLGLRDNPDYKAR